MPAVPHSTSPSAECALPSLPTCRPAGADLIALLLLFLGAVEGDGGMGPVLSQAEFARGRGTVRC